MLRTVLFVTLLTTILAKTAVYSNYDCFINLHWPESPNVQISLDSTTIDKGTLAYTDLENTSYSFKIQQNSFPLTGSQGTLVFSGFDQQISSLTVSCSCLYGSSKIVEISYTPNYSSPYAGYIDWQATDTKQTIQRTLSDSEQSYSYEFSNGGHPLTIDVYIPMDP